MIIFPGGVRKNGISEGEGGPFCEADFGKSSGEGVHRQNPFRGGGRYGYFPELQILVIYK